MIFPRTVLRRVLVCERGEQGESALENGKGLRVSFILGRNEEGACHILHTGGGWLKKNSRFSRRGGMIAAEVGASKQE